MSYEEACKVVTLSVDELRLGIDHARKLLRQREVQAGWTVSQLADEAECRMRNHLALATK